ncbi:MAG: 8-amino-7-oxononanoate synthase, partial [Acidobacteriota bacterium]
GAAEPLAGAPASRLVRGHTEVHAELETSLAAFKGTEAALLFPSGYQANVGLLQAVAGRGDRILSDALNHASLIDGMRLSKADVFVVPHADVDAFGRRLAEDWPGRTFLVTESLFSMDGDLAPLDAYAELCERHDASLIVDDAHATGLWGERGSGWVEALGLERRVLATISTFGKAFGAAGAVVAGSKTLIHYLVNTCRSFIFSTAVSPLACHAAAVALEVMQEEPERRRRVLELAARLRKALAAAGLEVPDGRGPIVPVVLGDERRALEVARRLQGAGFDVRAVRPPTVLPGTSRLRLSVHADHRPEEIDLLASLLKASVGAPSPAAHAVAR